MVIVEDEVESNAASEAVVILDGSTVVVAVGVADNMVVANVIPSKFGTKNAGE